MRYLELGELVLTPDGIGYLEDWGRHPWDDGPHYVVDGSEYRREQLFAVGDQVVDGDGDTGAILEVRPLTVQYSDFGYEWYDVDNADLHHVDYQKPDSGGEDLASWWDRTSAEDRDDCLAKTAEYGAGDLAVIGGLLADFGVTAAVGREAEMGCWFYLIGKVARANSAFERGEAPSDDTIKDIETYSRMIRRIRQNGEWG